MPCEDDYRWRDEYYGSETAGDDYDAGVIAGEDAGHQAALDGKDVVRPHDPDRTAFKDGHDDGFVAGYWATLNGSWDARDMHWGSGAKQ